MYVILSRWVKSNFFYLHLHNLVNPFDLVLINFYKIIPDTCIIHRVLLSSSEWLTLVSERNLIMVCCNIFLIPLRWFGARSVCHVCVARDVRPGLTLSTCQDFVPGYSHIYDTELLPGVDGSLQLCTTRRVHERTHRYTDCCQHAEYSSWSVCRYVETEQYGGNLVYHMSLKASLWRILFLTV